MKTESFSCDVCGKPIETDHEKLFMATITVSGYRYGFDDGGEQWSKTFHVHNDTSAHCIGEILLMLNRLGTVSQ